MAKILVVDDEAKIREIIKEYAEFEDYEVKEAADGMEAVEKHGAIVGSVLAAWRILRCNPFAKGGYDPVP